MAERIWLYLQIFPGLPVRTGRTDPLALERAADAMLLHHLLPCLADMRHDGFSGRYFFIRYAEGGYHLRVRSLCEGARAYETALARIHASLEASIADDASLFPGAVDVRALYSDGRLRESVYEPELQKYCGMHGLRVAEEHFEHCSRFAACALRLCESGLKRDHISMWMMGQAICSLGLQRQECSAMLAGYSQYWRSAFELDDPGSLESFWARKHELVSALLPDDEGVALYARRYPDVERALGGIRDLFRETMTRLEALEQAGMLEGEMPAAIAGGIDDASALRRSPLAYLLVLPNLLHMMNNRLGVHVATEALLAYCISRALQRGAIGVPPSIRIVLEPGLESRERQRRDSAGGRSVPNEHAGVL